MGNMTSSISSARMSVAFANAASMGWTRDAAPAIVALPPRSESRFARAIACPASSVLR